MSTNTNFNGIGAIRQDDNQKLQAQKEVAAKKEQVSIWEQQKADFEEKNGAASEIDGDKYAEEELTKEDYDAAQKKIDEATTAYESAVGLAETAASEAKDLSTQADNLSASGVSKKNQGQAALKAANSLPNEDPNKQQAINEANAMIEEGQKEIQEAEKLYPKAQEKAKEAEQLMAEAEEYKDLMEEIQEDINAATEGYESEGDEDTSQDNLVESNKKIGEITQNLEKAQDELKAAQEKLDNVHELDLWPEQLESPEPEPPEEEADPSSYDMAKKEYGEGHWVNDHTWETSDGEKIEVDNAISKKHIEEKAEYPEAEMSEEEADPSSYDMAKKEYGEGHWVNDHTWETSDGEKIEVDNAISKKHIEEKTKHPEPEEPEDMVYYFDNKEF